ncbi:MAG: Uma2 family endonuclease [Planctomycetes bacterium]|nr:Uma2 family endonuclease [Planctomycetota bacterium]
MEMTKVRVGPRDHGRRMPLEEFAGAAGERGYRYELSRGVVVVAGIPDLPHARVLFELDRQVIPWIATHRNAVDFYGSGDQCVLRLPGAQTERHPDRAFYLTPAPDPVNPWDRWIPDIMVEVVSAGGEERDYQEKRADYLAAGVREYWILDPQTRAVLVLQRVGDTFREVRPTLEYATPLLPGLLLKVPGLFEAAE